MFNEKGQNDDLPLAKLDVDLYQAAIHYEFYQPEDADLKMYVLGSLGAISLRPKDTFASTTKFAGAFGLGAKGYFNDRFGVRLQGRLALSNFGRGDVLCELNDNCYIPPDFVWLYVGDITMGLIVRF